MINLVTITIPVFNASEYLQYAIQSVINQTFKEWILILINDGSNDDSLSIMKKFASIDNRIRIIDDGLNKGLVSRLNESIRMTTTKYYARMDADDIMHITRIEKQVKYMEQHPEIDVLGSSIMIIDKDNNIVGSGLSKGYVERFNHPTVMGKTDWFKRNNYADWAIRAEDLELWCRTYRNSVFWSLDKPLLFYRELGIPSCKKSIASYKSELIIYSKYCEYGKGLDWFFTNSFKTLLKIFLYMLFACFKQEQFLVKKRRRVPVKDINCLSSEDLIASIRST